MQVIDNSGWLDRLQRLAALEEEAAKRIDARTLQEMEVARQMGDRKRFAQLAGYDPQYANPFYREQTEVTPGMKAMANLGLNPGEELMKSGLSQAEINAAPGQSVYADQAALDKYGPGISSMSDNAKAPLLGIKETPTSDKAFDVLSALKAIGNPDSPELYSRVANFNANNLGGWATQQYDKDGNKTEQTLFNENLPKVVTAQQQSIKAAKDWESNPAINQKYLDGATAGEMQQQIINNMFKAMQGKSEAEQRRMYALGINALLDTGVAYRRKDAEKILGGIDYWIPKGGSGPARKRLQIIFADGSIEQPWDPGVDNTTAWAEKTYGKRVKKLDYMASDAATDPMTLKKLEVYDANKMAELQKEYDEFWSMPGNKTKIKNKANALGFDFDEKGKIYKKESPITGSATANSAVESGEYETIPGTNIRVPKAR